MFHAFIVDDDPISIEATHILFPWEDVGITKIDKIDSPTGLVERILAEKPHVVFIDIEAKKFETKFAGFVFNVPEHCRTYSPGMIMG